MTNQNRDEFTPSVKRVLAQRVNYICSNPDCRGHTVGPSSDPNKSINVGVAAHITAAAPGGPRYDPMLSDEERKSSENGIWLCQKCGKLIDSDINLFSKIVLYNWKEVADLQALDSIKGIITKQSDFDIRPSVIMLQNLCDELSIKISDNVEKQIEEKREIWREGNPNSAFKFVKDTRADVSLFMSLDKKVKAKLIRFEASLELEVNEDTEKAKSLANEAKIIHSDSNETRIRALIAYREIDINEAIEILKNDESIDSINLRCAFLLQSGMLDECNKLLFLAAEKQIPNAETLRLKAILNLIYKNIHQAHLYIKKAIEIEPKWESVKITEAIIEYYLALSPAVLPNTLLEWPEPISLSIVKNDDESIQHLTNAATIFKNILKNPARKINEKKIFQTWYLASIANNPYKQDEAINYCKSIIKNDPTNYRFIAWTVDRNYKIDIKPCEISLLKLVNDKKNVQHILALATCYLKLKKGKKLVKLLNEFKSEFINKNQNELWKLWYAQAMLLNNNPDNAIKIIDECKQSIELLHFKSLALKAIAKRNKTWTNLKNYLLKNFKETNISIFLLEYCKIEATQQNWNLIVPWTDKLINDIQTLESIKLATFTLFNTGKLDKCNKILDDYHRICKQLPVELRHIHIKCKFLLGQFPDAIKDVNEILLNNPTTEDLLKVANVYLNLGDFNNLNQIAYRLKNAEDLNSNDMIWLSSIIQLEESELAVYFWKKSLEKGIPDNLVSTALDLGFKLGLDTELQPVFSRMEKLVQEEKDGIYIASLKELISITEENYKRGEKLNEFYQHARFPIQLLLEQSNLNLAHFYHDIIQKNENDINPLNNFCLFARHGGRNLNDESPKTKWRLNLDITAVLLSAHLEILSIVENTFSPLRIPSELIPTLVDIKYKLKHPQPARIKACKKIVDFENKKILSVVDSKISPKISNKKIIEELGINWVGLYDIARKQKGFIVDFLPLKTIRNFNKPKYLPKDAYKYIIDIQSIIYSLYENGPLSKEKYDSALKELGKIQPMSKNSIIPEKGKSLYCHGIIPEELARIGLLEIICQNFKVFIEKNELIRVKSEIHNFDVREDTANWVYKLIDRIRHGFENNLYEVIPKNTKTLVDTNKNKFPAYECIESLMQFKSQPEDRIWSDDRAINAYFYRDIGVPIIGINEVLRYLLNSEKLDSQNYFKLLYRLRASNIRYIPILKDEIIYFLNQANLNQNGVLIETNELTLLRRYLAACLVQNNTLQKPSNSSDTKSNKFGEMPFITGTFREITKALTDLWQNENFEQKKVIAKSEWILDKLYLSQYGMLKIADFHRDDNVKDYMLSLDFASFILNAFGIQSNLNSNKISPRKIYLDWIYNKFLSRRFDADKNIFFSVIDILKKHLTDLLDNNKLQIRTV